MNTADTFIDMATDSLVPVFQGHTVADAKNQMS